jgi:S-methylmethionine-dependent homocysteine/selenocysteine methylase
MNATDIVRQIHADYVAAGAELITANTFRTHERNLRAGGTKSPREEAARLTRLAVDLAREASGDAAWVAGSQAPLEDCYSPWVVPADDALKREHGQMADNLAAAGVDAILVETHNTLREAAAATRAAVATGLPVLTSFVCGADGRLLSGEPLSDAAAAILPLGPDAVLVNCAPAAAMEGMLLQLLVVCGDTTIGCYANIGEPDPVHGWKNTAAQAPESYAACARSWLEAGARLIGGCCGTTPEHTRWLRQMMQP